MTIIPAPARTKRGAGTFPPCTCPCRHHGGYRPPAKYRGDDGVDYCVGCVSLMVCEGIVPARVQVTERWA